MSVAFPSGYYLTKEASIEVLTNTVHDRMDDGSLRTRILGSDIYEEIGCVLPYLTESEYLNFKAFFQTNRGVDITMALDGSDYTGQITSGLRVNKQGNRFKVGFTYYAKAS